MEIGHHKWPLKAIVIPRAKNIDQLILALQKVLSYICDAIAT